MKGEHTAQTILRSAISGVRRNLMLDHSFLAFFNGDRFHLYAVVLFVEGFRKVVTIINDAISSKNVDLRSNAKILRGVKLLLGHVHTWVTGLDWFFGKFLLFQ